MLKALSKYTNKNNDSTTGSPTPQILIPPTRTRNHTDNIEQELSTTWKPTTNPYLTPQTSSTYNKKDLHRYHTQTHSHRRTRQERRNIRTATTKKNRENTRITLNASAPSEKTARKLRRHTQKEYNSAVTTIEGFATNNNTYKLKRLSIVEGYSFTGSTRRSAE